jgi:hypothetical protein
MATLGPMIGCIVYTLVAVALLCLWVNGGYGWMCWIVAIGAIMCAWTAGTVRTAYRWERDDMLAETPDCTPEERRTIEYHAERKPVVNFWLKVNMVVTGITVLLCLVAIVLSFL